MTPHTCKVGQGGLCGKGGQRGEALSTLHDIHDLARLWRRNSFADFITEEVKAAKGSHRDLINPATYERQSLVNRLPLPINSGVLTIDSQCI